MASQATARMGNRRGVRPEGDAGTSISNPTHYYKPNGQGNWRDVSICLGESFAGSDKQLLIRGAKARIVTAVGSAVQSSPGMKKPKLVASALLES